MPGNMLPAGTHTIRVTLEVSDTIAPGAAMSFTWRLSLVEQADELAATGSTAQLGVAAAALLALGAGAFLVGALNRRKGEQR